MAITRKSNNNATAPTHAAISTATTAAPTAPTMMEIDDVSELSHNETSNYVSEPVVPTNSGSNTTLESVDSTGNGTLASNARMVISNEEMKIKLNQDIEALKREIFKAVQTTVLTPIHDPNYEAIWARESKLNIKMERLTKTYKNLFGCDPTLDSKTLPAPSNLLLWQWKNKVFDKAKHIYETPDECVSDFENILLAHKRPITTYWKEYIIAVLPGPTLAWYNKLIEQKPSITWDNFKSSFIEYYGINPILQKEIALNNLLDMKYSHTEDIQEYIQRFHNLRAKAKMEDIDTLKWCLTDPLPPGLFKDVETNFRGQDLTAEKMTEILAFHYGIYIKSQQKRSEIRGKQPLSKNRFHVNDHSKPYSKYKGRYGITKKQYCTFHPSNSNHNTKQCRTRIRCIKKGLCFNCFKTYTPNHQCTKANTTTRTKNKVCKKGSKLIVPTKPDESSSSDSSDDEDSKMKFAAAQLHKIKLDCKSQTINLEYFQIPPESLVTDNLIYLPITIENANCWALCDTGANFSCISPTLCDFLNLNKINKNGSITLINDDKIKRCGKTEKQTRIQYGEKVLYSQLEIFKLFDNNVHASIGTDLLFKLGIDIKNIKVTWDGLDTRAKVPIIEPYPYTPNEDPYFTPQEQEYLLKEIEPYITENNSIPKAAYCTIPGSEIKLPLKKDAPAAYRRQYPINECHIQAVRDQVQKWIGMGIVEKAPANIPYNSPLLIVPKKNPKTGEYDHTNVRCVIDSRLVNKSLDNKRIDRFPLPLISDLHRIISK
jgi:hypothetical protein